MNYAPLTTDEIRDLTAMVYGAPASVGWIKEIGEPLIRTLECLQLTGARPVDPAVIRPVPDQPATPRIDAILDQYASPRHVLDVLRDARAEIAALQLQAQGLRGTVRNLVAVLPPESLRKAGAIPCLAGRQCVREHDPCPAGTCRNAP